MRRLTTRALKGYAFWRKRVPRRAPAHLRENRSRWWLLYRYANATYGRYGVPVYLVGSALRDDNPEPRDWDIRLEVSEADFRRMYGDPVEWVREGASGNWTAVRWRWSDDCTKNAREAHRWTHVNVDFQIYPRGYARQLYGEQPRLRLDTRGRE